MIIIIITTTTVNGIIITKYWQHLLIQIDQLHLDSQIETDEERYNYKEILVMLKH